MEKFKNDRASGAVGRGRIFNSIIDTMGSTPIVRLSRLALESGVEATLLAKLEFFNPMGSVKDRIGVSMIEHMERAGKLDKDTVIVEPTSGNTGIALAFVAAAKGYQLILILPDSMSIERRRMLLLLGAKLELTPVEKGMNGAIARAEELVEKLPKAVMPQQFENEANPFIHRITTAEEIWSDTNGCLDFLVAGIGTGGTITGVGEVLKEKRNSIRVVGVEPEDSPVLSGGKPGRHEIEGIGAGFVPGTLNQDVIDEVVTIGNETAFETARLVAAVEGIPVGISSGAAVAAMLEVAAREQNKNKTFLVIIPSFAERYLSTPLFEGLG